MELFDAIDTQSLTDIEELIQKKNLFLNNNPLSYRALMKAFAYERKDVVRFLLNSHCKVNVTLKTYSLITTPLHCAIKLRDLDLIKEILQKNPSIVEPDSDGNSSLHLAFSHKLDEAVDLILSHIEQKSVFINAKNIHGLTHMHIACTRKNTNVIRGFLKAGIKPEDSTVNDNSPSWPGYTSLHFAAEFGSLQAFSVLKSAKIVEQATVNPNRKTPWQLVQDQLQDLLVMSYFLEDKNYCETGQRQIYFLLACLRKDPSLLKKLFDMGANVNYGFFQSPLNSSWNSALHFAVERNLRSTVELLFQHGATLKHKNCFSMTALHVANVNLTGRENDYGTLLHVAFEIGNKDLIEILLDNSADVKSIRALDGSTMLHLLVANLIEKYKFLQQNALSSDKQAILMYTEQLISMGVEVNAQDKYGSTAFHVLELEEKECALKLLVEHGADINLENASKHLPLHSQFYKKSRCDSAEYLVFYHHVQKLRSLGLEVHPNNESVYEMILHDLKKLESYGKICKTKELTCREQQRLDEVARLKNIMITSYMSLYNFLKLTPSRAAAYVLNSILEDVLAQKDFDKTYPSYGYLIQLQYTRNYDRLRAKDFKQSSCCSETDEDSPSSCKRQRLE